MSPTLMLLRLPSMCMRKMKNETSRKVTPPSGAKDKYFNLFIKKYYLLLPENQTRVSNTYELLNSLLLFMFLNFNPSQIVQVLFKILLYNPTENQENPTHLATHRLDTTLVSTDVSKIIILK